MSSSPIQPAAGPPPAISAIVPLVRSFRFLHEPVQSANASRFVGRDTELSAFVERLIFSNGGSFLVTGYRGVGKTSFINLALSRLDDAVRAAEPVLGARTRVVSIALNIARPVQPAELMHYIVRRLYERLMEMGIVPLLDDDTREALRRAYDRTSFNMARKLSESSERSYGVGEAGLTNSLLGATAKLSWSEKRSRSQNYEMTFLGYDDRAAEHDIITIARTLCAGYVEPMSRVRRFVRWLRREGAGPRTALKIIFVFDELDKLEEFTIGEGNTKKPVIDEILGSLKNVFTTSGVTFVFVAGKDLQERWLDDVGKGDSVYESVFSFDRYLPCLWGDTFSICDQLVDMNAAPRTRAFERFKGFLAYKGRGIPRRIVRTFNEYVSWRENQPMLVFTHQQLNRITFFAGLHVALERHAPALFGESREEATGTQSDKRRLGVYYLVDWMMRQSRPFTLADVASASKRLSVKIALAEEIAPRVIEDVIVALVDGEYLQEVSTKLDEAVIGAPGAPTERRYEIPPRRVIEMGGTTNELEEDSQLLSAIGASADSDAGLTRIGKWRILEAIGEGGMGNVYRATDDAWLLVVAIKTVRRDLVANADILKRFEREAAVMKLLSHPNLVRFFEAGHADGRPYIVMEYLDGVTLHRIMDTLGKLDLAEAVAIARQIADGMQCIHEQGIVRNDLKPANVMILPTGRVCLLDFGISKFAHEMEEAVAAHTSSSEHGVNTDAGLVVGTPRYMAPELVEQRPADARSDVYSLGVLLYQMLTRNLPFDGENASQIFRAWHTTKPKPPSTFAAVPKAVDAVILRCLALEPEGRYATMADLATSLAAAAGPLSPANIGSLAVRARERAQALDSWGRDSTLVHGPDPGAQSDAYTPLPFEAATAPAARSSEATTAESPISPAPAPQTPAQPAAPTTAAPPLRPTSDTDPNVIAPIAPPVAQSSAPVRGAPEQPGVGTSGRPRIVPLDSTGGCDISLVPDGEAYLLKPKETTFGRIAQNDIVLLSPTVSRYHGRFIVAGEHVFVEAFPTTNGVRVDGTRVTERRALTSGQVVEIGDFRFLFTS